MNKKMLIADNCRHCNIVMLKRRDEYERSSHYCKPCSRNRNQVALKGSIQYRTMKLVKMYE